MKLLVMLLTMLMTLSIYSAECKLRPKTIEKFKQAKIKKLARYLKRNPDQNTPDCRGKLLTYAIRKKDKNLVRFFLTSSTNLNYIGLNNTLNPALEAINLLDYKTLRLLLKNGVDPNSKIAGKKLIDIGISKKNYLITKALEDFGGEETLDCSLKNNMMPKCYHKRDKAVMKIALVYYGASMKMKDLDRIEPLLIERFLQATNGAVGVEIISKKVIGFNKKMPADYKFKNITDKKRLQRIWYYDNVGMGIMKEVYQEYKKEVSDKLMDELDAIVGITGGQFDGLGFASGRVSVTEYPQERAWNLEDGGATDYPSDYKIVDELIHELGHNMFLGHASTQCTHGGLTLDQRQECCAQSPSKDDVLSYCRNRRAVNETFMHGFESCNQEMIEDLIVPAMLDGGKWQVEPRTACE